MISIRKNIRFFLGWIASNCPEEYRIPIETYVEKYSCFMSFGSRREIQPREKVRMYFASFKL